MALHNIIGQEKAVRILSGTIKRERVPSSILFSGDSGIGKRFAALNYAKVLNCMEPVDSELKAPQAAAVKEARAVLDEARSHHVAWSPPLER